MMNQSIYFFPFFFYIGVGLLFLSGILMYRSKYSWWKLILFGIFWLYAMLILSQALFPIPIVEMDAASARQQVYEIIRRINWTPFSYGPFTRNWAVFREVVLNFLITVPAGFILPIVFTLGKRGVFTGILISAFGIEFLQLTLEIFVGVPYRVIDISDVILNSGGFLLGYLLYYLSMKVFHILQEKF